MASDRESVSLQDGQMMEVSKEFFFDGMLLPVTVYLKMKDNHYLIIGKETEKVSFSILHSFQNKNSKIYVLTQDHSRLIGYMTQLTERVINTKEVPNTIKSKFFVGLTENALREVHKSGAASVGELQKVSQMMVDMSENISGFSDVFEFLKDLPEDDTKHSLSTCMISLMLAGEMNINIRGTLEKVAFGALLHDVGHKFLPVKLLEKPRHIWTHEENLLYESHPLKGVEMLRDLKEVSNEVLLIVAEHHENAIGTGFPKRIRDVKVSPLSRIVIVANYFSDLIFSRHDASKHYDANEALLYIEEILGQPFNKQIYSCLKNLVNRAYLEKKKAG